MNLTGRNSQLCGAIILCVLLNGFKINARSNSQNEKQFLKSNEVIHVGENAYVRRHDSSRVRRQLDSDDRSYADKHNELRRIAEASNMRILEWNDDLAAMALEWAQGCAWGHGQPDYSNPPYESIGQNLYVTTGNVPDSEAVQDWYDEIVDYDFDTNTCNEGRVCGHYTQVVWDDTETVGCASHICDSMAGLDDYENAWYLVCNYGPAGNYPRAPYTSGDACTQCNSGVFWCNDGLCTDECSVDNNDCECEARCRNCGTVDTDACSCTCTPGWTGVDCSEECADTNENCNASPGWPPAWCDQEHSYVLEECPVMCGLCEVADGSDVACDEDDDDDDGDNNDDDGDDDDNDDDGDNSDDDSDDDDDDDDNSDDDSDDDDDDDRGDNNDDNSDDDDDDNNNDDDGDDDDDDDGDTDNQGNQAGYHDSSASTIHSQLLLLVTTTTVVWFIRH